MGRFRWLALPLILVLAVGIAFATGVVRNSGRDADAAAHVKFAKGDPDAASSDRETPGTADGAGPAWTRSRRTTRSGS
jgi:hypothetical protein